MILCNQNKWVSVTPQGIVAMCSHSWVWRFNRKIGGEVSRRFGGRRNKGVKRVSASLKWKNEKMKTSIEPCIQFLLFCLPLLCLWWVSIASLSSTGVIGWTWWKRDLRRITLRISDFNRLESSDKKKRKEVAHSYATTCLVAGEGLEPSTSGLWIRRSNQLSYPAITTGFFR